MDFIHAIDLCNDFDVAAHARECTSADMVEVRAFALLWKDRRNICLLRQTVRGEETLVNIENRDEKSVYPCVVPSSRNAVVSNSSEWHGRSCERWPTFCCPKIFL